MRHETVTLRTDRKVDWQGLGYLMSVIGVIALATIAWPKGDDPAWHGPVLIVGVATAIIGMVFRYKAHRDQVREVRKAKAEARRA